MIIVDLTLSSSVMFSTVKCYEVLIIIEANIVNEVSLEQTTKLWVIKEEI